MSSPSQDALIAAARSARMHAYAPYSGFRVGAALRSASGVIYTGCNIENASYGATVCAERVAIASMVANGDSQWTHLAVFTDVDPPVNPCGLCLQVLVEFAADGEIFLAGPSNVTSSTLHALLPSPFAFDSARGSSP
jgi:cytidine deaminase